MTEFLVDGPDAARRTYLFAHGAGGPMRSAFMAQVARGIAAAGIRVIRFEFPYMAQKRKRPDPQPVLLDAFRTVVGEIGSPQSMVIGGKSMGGRMASMIADELGVAGLLVYGYPFHPPGQPQKTRTAHLEHLQTRALIVQGTRDAFGTPNDVESYKLSSTISIAWIEGGDHSLKGGLPKAIETGVKFITAI
ncbi:MAG TPA: alpha/beta fold hydrolase [Thermoanaerobaculia bacterium]|nr:alpha/beta fold hydrolase [Thermoanaerobaculia bacterium]